jgi:hypothetical protein
MTAQEFFSEWSTKHSNLSLSVRDITGAFAMTTQQATKMMQRFVREGKVSARYYTASRVTVYSLSNGAAK